MRRITFLAMTLVLMGSATFAQDRFSKVSWELGIPTGDLKEYLNNGDVSAGGISFDYRKLVGDNWTVGGSAAWSFFNGSTRENLVTGTTTVSGLRQFYFNSLPFMANTHYYMDVGSSQLYFGTGIGGVWTLQRTEIGSFYTDNDNFHFGVVPEIGFVVPISFTSNINISAKYNYALKTSKTVNYSYFTFGVGWSSWW